MKARKNLLTFIIFAISLVQAIAQNISIRGNVSDKAGEPLIGATVVVEDSPDHGTVTDIEGNYMLDNIPVNSNLKFSYVGMVELLESVNNRTIINVALSDDTELLDEIIVVGYGTQKKSQSHGFRRKCRYE